MYGRCENAAGILKLNINIVLFTSVIIQLEQFFLQKRQRLPLVVRVITIQRNNGPQMLWPMTIRRDNALLDALNDNYKK